MPAPLRRVVRFLRLALVCLTLVWSSAPAAAAPITDTIVLVAVTRAVPAERAAPADRTARAPEPGVRTFDGEPFAGPVTAGSPAGGPITATRAPSPPRRLYLEHRALLC